MYSLVQTVNIGTRVEIFLTRDLAAVQRQTRKKVSNQNERTVPKSKELAPYHLVPLVYFE